MEDGLSARRDKGGNPMLWYCRFEWQPGVTRQQVAERVVQQHEAGNTHPERIKGWYNLAGGGAGFLLVETQRPQDLTAFLQPYMDVVRFDVHAAYALDYEQQIQQLRQVSDRLQKRDEHVQDWDNPDYPVEVGP
jgi:hypothetical protein